ncbi:hypothetical protein K8I85_11760 [bacterium]|nr:hypothetical protein [bacterium]
MKSKTLVTLFLLTALPAVGSADPARPDTRARELPAWRLQASPYSRSSGVGFGAYRRLAPTVDLGVMPTITLSESDGDGGRTQTLSGGTTTTDRNEDHSQTHAFGLSAELRKWFFRGDNVSWFVGPRVYWNYSRSRYDLSGTDDVGTDAESIDRATRDSRSSAVGTGVDFGVDLLLLSRFSVMMALEPLSFDYGWGQSTDSGNRIDPQSERPYRYYSKDTDYGLRGRVLVGVYVTMLL